MPCNNLCSHESCFRENVTPKRMTYTQSPGYPTLELYAAARWVVVNRLIEERAKAKPEEARIVRWSAIYSEEVRKAEAILNQSRLFDDPREGNGGRWSHSNPYDPTWIADAAMSA